MNKFLKNVLFALLTILTTTVWAQTLNVNQFGIEEGLPQSKINTLLHDKAGNIWIGTHGGGVSKYNGLRFQNFSLKDSLAENRVLSSCLDHNGNIWFGHYSGSISKYDVKTGKFHEVRPPSSIVSYKNITSILEDKDGNLYFGTNDLGIIKYVPSAQEKTGEVNDKESGEFSLIKKEQGLSSNVINALIQDKTGVIWVATDNGVTKINNGKYEYLNDANGLSSNLINAVLQDSKGNIWLGTNDMGALRLNGGSASDVTNYTIKHGLGSNTIRVIYEDNKGNIFFGTLGGGVSKYLPQLEANKYNGPIFQNINTSRGLSNDKVYSIIQDRENNIWIGTNLNLNQYFDEQFEIYGINEGFDNSLIWSVIQDKKGTFWLGTEGGLYKFIPKANSNDSKPIRVTGKEGQVLNTNGLYEDAEGMIWFSEFGNGVSRYNPETKNTTRFTKKEGLLSNEVWTVSGDKNGEVWIGTQSGGASKFDYKTKKFQNYTMSDKLGSNDVYTLFKDSKGNLWFGMLRGELTMYDGSDFKKFGKAQGYNSLLTVCITEDKNGTMWFGTVDKGIYSYDGKEFKNFTEKDGLSSDTPFLIQADDKNNLWIGTGLGIDKFSITDQTFKHYGKQDGFLGVEINPNAVCKDNDGNLWFGSIIGLVKYSSRVEGVNPAEPIVYLKSPRLFFKDFEMPENKELSYNQNHLTFDFVGASLTNPKRVRYKYQLIGGGVDTTIVGPIKENFATFSNVAPGSYTFNVWACNNDGVWNSQPTSYTFTVLKPWYTTWWFITLCIVGGLLGVYLYSDYRSKALVKRNAELEEVVTIRTQEVRKEKEHVEQQNVEIQNQKVELEKKNANITDSIDYAKRIQEAMFVPLQEIKRILPDSFVLFRPKDIVSGDFYWASEIKGKKLFCAADCTGHGVPGAFMSIIGNNLINDIVNDKGVTSPAQILNELNKSIGQTLNSGDDGSKVKDGMDIAMCCYDPASGTLEFAGAYNPLYLIRNGALEEIKADKLPVGKSSFHDAQQFTNNNIKVEKGDIVYLFSDGYADQIGGPKRKKFYYGAFKQLLTDIHKLPVEQQSQKLDKAMNDWLGSREQLDDIIVMGVRF